MVGLFIIYPLNVAKNFAKWPNSKSSKVVFCLSSSSFSLTTLRQNLLTQMKQFFHENTAREPD